MFQAAMLMRVSRSDVEAMAEAASLLEGRHDFAAFRSVGSVWKVLCVPYMSCELSAAET